MLAEAEAAIVKRVEAVVAPFEVTVAPFPGDSHSSTKPGRKGMILIGYKKALHRITSMQPMTCEIIAEFELSLQLKNLRTHRGAYPLLDTIRYAITGFIPLKGPLSKCYPVQEGFLNVEDGIWHYAIVVAVAMIQIEGQRPYTASSDDYLTRDPSGGVPPYDPVNPIQIKTGVRRAIINDLDTNVIDKEILITENGATTNSSSQEDPNNPQYIPFLP